MRFIPGNESHFTHVPAAGFDAGRIVVASSPLSPTAEHGLCSQRNVAPAWGGVSASRFY